MGAGRLLARTPVEKMKGSFAFGEFTVDVEDLPSGDVAATISVLGEEPFSLIRAARPEGYSIRAAAAEALLYLMLLAGENPEITEASIEAQTRGLDEESRIKANTVWLSMITFAKSHANRLVEASAFVKKYFRANPDEAVRILRGYSPGDLVFYWDEAGHAIGLDLWSAYIKAGGRYLKPGEEIYNVRRFT
jgi:hypothetical protein